MLRLCSADQGHAIKLTVSRLHTNFHSAVEVHTNFRKSQIPRKRDVHQRVDSFRQPRPVSFWFQAADSPRLLQPMLLSDNPMDEDNSRAEKPLTRPRELPETSAISAEEEAITSHPPDSHDIRDEPPPGTPEHPPRNRPRRAVVDDGPSPEDVAVALNGKQDTNPTKQKSKATRAISLDEVDSKFMADAPAALPEGELRVRRVRPQRTVQTLASIATAYRAPTCARICATETPQPARYVTFGNGTCDGVVMGFVHTVVSDLWFVSCGCVRPPLMSTPPHWWDQARKSIPSTPPATTSDHTSASLATLLTQPSLVLLPPTIPRHSNYSPLSPCYTTHNHHLTPLLHSDTRLAFPLSNHALYSNHKAAALAILLTQPSLVLLPPTIPHHSNHSLLSPCYTTHSYHLAPPLLRIGSRLAFPPGHSTLYSNHTAAALATLLTQPAHFAMFVMLYLEKKIPQPPPESCYINRIGINWLYCIVLYCIVFKSLNSCVQTKDETTWHLSQLDLDTTQNRPAYHQNTDQSPGAHRCSTPFYEIIHLRPAHTCSNSRTPALLTNQGRTLIVSPVPAS